MGGDVPELPSKINREKSGHRPDFAFAKSAVHLRQKN